MGLVTFLIFHLGIALWFGATLQTKVSAIQKSLDEMNGTMKELASNLQDSDVEAARRAGRLEGLERRIEKLEEHH